ncbi:MAG: phosphotransferase family protein [Candidatus Saccharimonadales bacterium]
MEQTVYEWRWQAAREQAKADGLQIIEHGWEQHVIIDEACGIVYRYPRHKAAADKLADEVSVLRHIHKQEWLVALPIMLKHNSVCTSYKLIVGDVLDAGLLASLSERAIVRIGAELGAFLVQLHTFDPVPIQRKKTKQTTTLYEYYKKRIDSAHSTKIYQPAQAALAKLAAGLNTTKPVVVHGDLHGLNIVIDSTHQRVKGVIDLSEMEIGDPHQDFRKLFMTDPRLLAPAVTSYQANGGQRLVIETVRTWAYVNEWANLCHFAKDTQHPTYKRALRHLQKWNQI